jgi:hypothetical protein
MEISTVLKVSFVSWCLRGKTLIYSNGSLNFGSVRKVLSISVSRKEIKTLISFVSRFIHLGAPPGACKRLPRLGFLWMPGF